MLLDGVNHGVDGLLHASSFLGFANLLAQGNIVLARDDEQSGNHEALGLGALADVLGGLERLVGVPREAVEVQAVVPVGTANERQGVWAEVLDDVVHGHLQVLEERHLGAGLVVEGNHLVKDREVARLLDIRHGAEDEPAGVVVESAADVIVAALGQRLVLVVAAAVGELCRGDVDDALAGT